MGDVVLEICIYGTGNLLFREAPVPVLQVINEHCILNCTANINQNLHQ